MREAIAMLVRDVGSAIRYRPPCQTCWRAAFSLFAITLGLTGCETLSSKATVADSPPVHTWLLESCPSADAEGEEVKSQVTVKSTAVPALLIAAGVDFLFSRAKAALAEAAERDRKGEATDGTNAGYLWWKSRFKSDGKEIDLRRPVGCLAVAISETAPAAWCKIDGPFKTANAAAIESVQKARSNFCDHIAGLIDESDGNDSAPSLQPTQRGDALPKFYAEIRLMPSRDARGLYPKLQLLYYPAGIHGGKFKSDKPRDVVVTAAGVSPGGENGLSPVLMTFPGLSPSKDDLRVAENVVVVTPLWAAPAAYAADYPVPADPGPFFPVNVSSSVREVGKENVFLQAFAEIFAAQSDARAGAVKERLLAEPPSPTALQSAYDEQARIVHSAQADLLALCAATPVVESGVQAGLLALHIAHRDLGALKEPASTYVFSPSAEKVAGLVGNKAEDICAEFRM